MTYKMCFFTCFCLASAFSEMFFDALLADLTAINRACLNSARISNYDS